MMPCVSVIMSTYNNESTIREAVSSILDQSYTGFELIVVNDGSVDQTKEILEGFSDQRMKLLHNSDNIGLTRSLNKAIAISSGRYIARQDADDLSMTDRLEKQVRFMEAHPDVGLLGTSRLTLDGAGKVTAKTILPKEPGRRQLLKSNCFVHGSVMLRREVLDDLGLYNEDFRLSQDYELWLRIAKKYKVMNLQEPLYCIRRHGGRVTLSRLPQAYLFRLLAVNMSLGNVDDEIVRRIRSEGIEVYYCYLATADKIRFHRAAMAKYAKYKLYEDAQLHLDRWRSLAPCSIRCWLDSAYLNFVKRNLSN